MTASTTFSIAAFNVAELDDIICLLQDVEKRVQVVRDVVLSQQNKETTNAIPADAADIPSKLENALQSVLSRAQALLTSLPATKYEPKPASNRTLRSSKSVGPPLVRSGTQDKAQLPRRWTGKRSGKRRPLVVGEQMSQDEEHQSAQESPQEDEATSTDDQEEITGGRRPWENDEPILDPNHLDSAHPPFAVPSSQCDFEELGSCTVSTLEKFTSLPDVQRTGMCHLRIRDFSSQVLDFDLGSVQDANRTRTDLKYNAASTKQAGVMVISSDCERPPNAAVPISSEIPRQEYSDSQLEDIFENFCKSDAASKPQWYLIGPSKDVLGEQCRYVDLLTAGPYLEQSLNGTIPGVNTSYIYASYSTGQTATAMHYEDCAWFSVNLVLSGAPKLWLSIEPESNEKFEAALEVLFPGEVTKCSQRIRHLSVFLAPSLLKEFGVKYHIKACYPGELIFTTPTAYHQIINMGPNLAEAINFMDRTIPPYPQDYQFCSRSICGFNDSVDKQNFRLSKRPWLEEQVLGTAESKRRCNAGATLELTQLRNLSLEVGDCFFNNLAAKSPATLVVSIFSKRTLVQLCQLIHSWKSDDHDGLTSAPLSDQNEQSWTVAYRRAAKDAHQQTNLALLRERVNTYAYVSQLEKLRKGALNLSTESVNDILRQEKKPITPNTRRALSHDFSTNMKWLSLCRRSGLGPSLLALLPLQAQAPYCLSTSTILKMNDGKIKESKCC